MDNIKNVPQDKWDQLSQQKIYFGHKSVGVNILDGIQLILKNNPTIRLNIVESNDPKVFINPVFAHAPNGQNGNPKSKIDTFYKTIENGLGDKADMAGFKFCYVDFNSKTDIEDVFNHYQLVMKKISFKYPKIKIIHYTTPLRTLQTGPKAFIKKILGKSIGIEDNIARQQFNTLLINEFGDQYIFDLAKYESSYTDGKREFTLVNNEKIYSMIPAYSDDGGHLSKIGKNKISANFLLYLLELTNDGSN